MEKIFTNAEMDVVRYDGILAGFGKRSRSEHSALQGKRTVSGLYAYLRFDEGNTVYILRDVIVLEAIERVLAAGQRCALYIVTKKTGPKRCAFVIGADIGETHIYPLGPVDKVSGL